MHVDVRLTTGCGTNTCRAIVTLYRRATFLFSVNYRAPGGTSKSTLPSVKVIMQMAITGAAYIQTAAQQWPGWLPHNQCTRHAAAPTSACRALPGGPTGVVPWFTAKHAQLMVSEASTLQLQGASTEPPPAAVHPLRQLAGQLHQEPPCSGLQPFHCSTPTPQLLCKPLKRGVLLSCRHLCSRHAALAPPTPLAALPPRRPCRCCRQLRYILCAPAAPAAAALLAQDAVHCGRGSTSSCSAALPASCCCRLARLHGTHIALQAASNRSQARPASIPPPDSACMYWWRV